MTFFEFLMVLIGLVGAIAISAILTYIGHITRNWQHVKNPTLFLLLCLWLIFNVIGHLSGIWAYRLVDLEATSTVFVVIAPVIFFTLAVTTLVPSRLKDNEKIDLDDVYFSSSGGVYIFLFLHESAALGADYLPGVINAPPPVFMLTMMLIFLVAMMTKHKNTHYALLLLVSAAQAIPAMFPLVEH
jgi:hypothetical protein